MWHSSQDVICCAPRRIQAMSDHTSSPYHLVVSVAAQRLHVYDLRKSHALLPSQWDATRWQVTQEQWVRSFSISTAKNGVGNQRGSFCTPLGRHQIRAKIGAGAAFNTVFVGRRPTGEVWSPSLAQQHPSRDWILTRILWLSGLEPGVNRLGDVDTMRRYVYLHGSPATVEMGEPGSIGCVRMRNQDIVDLFDWVPAGTTVMIDY
jgi:lipoprotein-anchoring transpeptidase ErfK/SrfK